MTEPTNPLPHDLYTDKDADRPDVICDRNGQVVLSLCKHCNRGEAELLDQPYCHRKGEVIGFGAPVWPADLKTFAERQAYQRGTADARAVDQFVREHAAAPVLEARYRFLLGFLIERGVLTDKRYPNGTWSLQGIYGVDDSGLRGAGRTPEEALDNAMTAVNLDPTAAAKFWQATHAALTPATGAQTLRILRQSNLLSGSEKMALTKAIDALEILNRRPRPLCRDCADEYGTCPNSGLPCDMQAVIRDARALASTHAAAPATEAQDEAVPYPKAEDATEVMRYRFERLFQAANRRSHATLKRHEDGSYFHLSVQADWIFYRRAWADALEAAAPATGAPIIINGKPATARSLLAALLDIYQDQQNAPPESRCYVPSAWEETIAEAKRFLASTQAAAPATGAPQGAQTLREACEALLRLIRQDAPQLSGKVIGDAERVLASTQAAAPATGALTLREAAENFVHAYRQRYKRVSGSLRSDAPLYDSVGAIVAALASTQAEPSEVPENMRLVPVEFVRGVGDLAHNYSMRAIPPDYYSGTDRDAFSAAYARCGQDLARVWAMVSPTPKDTPPKSL